MTDTATARRPTRGDLTRERILDAASALFDAHGVHGVSADRVIHAAETTKVTFYRHFPSKDALVIAYLARRAADEREKITLIRARSAGDAATALALFADVLDEIACLPGFCGCPFINTAAAYPEEGHPVRTAVRAHREWLAAELEEMLAEGGVRDAADAAEEVVLLRDGALVSGSLLGRPLARERLAHAMASVLRGRLG